MKKQRRVFTRKFKAEAVRMRYKDNKPDAEAPGAFPARESDSQGLVNLIEIQAKYLPIA